mmetsp:Transcript_2351/g.6833  ORF Transcript_2351/g.6833 Transcript_2351/m.6833 type:complete len:268 (+) Transcript_2351:1240-2043(+)
MMRTFDSGGNSSSITGTIASAISLKNMSFPSSSSCSSSSGWSGASLFSSISSSIVYLRSITSVLAGRAVGSPKISAGFHKECVSPGKPPPMSKTVILKPYSASAKSNKSRASLRASAYRLASRQPLPTWKETPTTSMPWALAAERSALHRLLGAPYLDERRHWLPESSVMIRRMSCIFVLTEAHFFTSATLSYVIMVTPRQTASMMCDLALVGLAKIISGDLGALGNACSLASSWTNRISFLDAQSKLHPRVNNVCTITLSGLHLTA